MSERFVTLALALAMVLAPSGSPRAESDGTVEAATAPRKNTAFERSAEVDGAFYTSATVDALAFRPLAAVATVVGVVLFVPAAIVTAPNGLDGVNEAWELFVTGPADHVTKRPLGEF